MIIKVSRRFKRLRQAEVAPFFRNVFTLMDGVAAYAALQALLAGVVGPLRDFEESLAARQYGGQILTRTKNTRRKILFAAADALAKGLEDLADGNADLIAQAGFEVVGETRQRYDGPLEAPLITFMESTGKRGQMRLEFYVPLPQAVDTNEIEISYNGQPFIRIKATRRQSITLRDIQGPGSITLRVRSLGRFDNDSPWSGGETRDVL